MNEEKLEYNDYYNNVLGKAAKMKEQVNDKLGELVDFLVDTVEKYGTWPEGMGNQKLIVVPDDLAAEVQRLIDTYPDWIRYTGWDTLNKYVVGVVENALEAQEDSARSKDYLPKESVKG